MIVVLRSIVYGMLHDQFDDYCELGLTTTLKAFSELSLCVLVNVSRQVSKRTECKGFEKNVTSFGNKRWLRMHKCLRLSAVDLDVS